ncbi:Sensor protein FixL [Andreprevotia sp. IGB-42]|uniref:PAS domain-containing sensor histidine kinase n=1 Tax=Andreprevotia sp. IGB-42 TaxID=2497473 RepID=UPI00135C6C1F|nr:PAS domain-containing sensor histidine kinase [Andreprevotia sp. IGB-42]KAF0813159.1 Sensor protein FixL [Andreprevotia sp. IGB-42]
MPHRSYRHFLLRCLTVLVAALAIGLCLYAADHVEKTADENLLKLARQDTGRVRQTLSDWVELRRQTLRGLAALFAGSSGVEHDEFDRAATVLRKQGDSTVQIPLAYALVSADNSSLKIVYSTETAGPLALGRELASVPEAATLMHTAFPSANRTISSPVLFDAAHRPYAYMSYPLEHVNGRRALMLTIIRYTELFRIVAGPQEGIVLRVQVTPPGGKPTFVNGSEAATPGTLFTIPYSGELYGSRFHHYGDILGNYPGRQSSAQRLATTLRYGGSLLTLIVMLMIWKMLNLYRQSLQRATALEEAHSHMQESEQHYRTLVDQVPGVVFRAVMAPERRKVYFSPAVEALTGYRAEELLGSHRFRELIAAEDAERVQAVLNQEQNAEGRYEVEYRIHDRDGKQHWVSERNQVFVDAHGVRMIDGVLIDISEHKAIEVSLQSKVNLLRGIFDNAPDVLIHGLTLDGDFSFCNKASESILGWQEHELLGKPFKSFNMVSSEAADHALSLFSQMAQSMQPLPPGEWLVTRRNGKPCVILATLFPILDEHDDIIIVTIGLDITERKRIEESLRTTRDHLEDLVTERTDALQRSNRELKQAMGQLVQSEKLASLGSLVAGIAHELNTPLGNSVTVASTLRQKVHEFRHLLDENQLRRSELEHFTEACEEAATLIEKSSQRAGDLINNFKQVAVDTASTRRRVFDLKQTMEEVVSTLLPLLKHTPHRIEIDIPPGTHMTSYPGPLEQIITNLVTNSLKHAFDQRDDGMIRIAASASASEIELIYEDNGNGIPEALKRRVFDPFFTTKLGQGGSGLGLYIVFNLIHGVLGGQLKLSDAEHGGTRFAITLPKQAPLPQESASDEQPAPQ